jgi:S1 domain
MSDQDAKLCDIAVQVKHETAKAYLVNDGAKDVWLPKSQVELDDSQGDEAAIVTMPEWLARDKGLI